MATTVVERWQENNAAINHESGTTCSRAFQVHFDTQQGTSSPLVACAAVTSSAFAVDIGSAYPGRAKVLCLNKTASPMDEDMLTWLVICSYGQVKGGTMPVSTGNPNISFGSVNRQMVPTYCWGGALDADPATIGYAYKSIQKNSANFVFPDIPPVDRINLLIRIDLKDSGSFNPGLILSHLNHLNTAAITVADVDIPQWQGRINSMTAEKVDPENGFDYWIVHYEIEVAVDYPMYLSVLDAGTHDLDSGKDAGISGANGASWPLNGAGLALTTAQKATGTNFHWWRFYHNVASDWSALNLPASV